MSDPIHDPLIHPRISLIAALVQSGKATAEDLAKPYPMPWQRVPPSLLPFIKSPSLATLTEVLTSRPLLCGHPLVFCQIAYLFRLCWDQPEWDRLGWERQYDADGDSWPPREVLDVYTALQQIIEAFGRGLLPHKRIRWAPQSQKRGPVGGFRNPHAMAPWLEWIDIETLDADERNLRKIILARRHELKRLPHENTRAETKIRIQQLALEALKDSGAAGWSDAWREYVELEETAAQPPVDKPSPEASEPQQSAWSQSWPLFPVIEQLKPLPLDDAIETMLLPGKRGRAFRDGNPAYFAYAVLGVLLGVTPEKIMNTLDNYRRPRRRKRKR